MMLFKNANERITEPYITVGNGSRFYPSRPEFDIKVIAGALSKQCRFGGHIKRHCSVAEHSVIVHDLMKRFALGSDPFEGLMHDAQEAYLPDMPTPWKIQLPDYKKLERSIEIPLRRWAGLHKDLSDGCKMADHIALYVEATELVEGGLGSIWSCEDWDAGIKSMADEYIACTSQIGIDAETAEKNFLFVYWKYNVPTLQK